MTETALPLDLRHLLDDGRGALLALDTQTAQFVRVDAAAVEAVLRRTAPVEAGTPMAKMLSGQIPLTAPRSGSMWGTPETKKNDRDHRHTQTAVLKRWKDAGGVAAALYPRGKRFLAAPVDAAVLTEAVRRLDDDARAHWDAAVNRCVARAPQTAAAAQWQAVCAAAAMDEALPSAGPGRRTGMRL